MAPGALRALPSAIIRSRIFEPNRRLSIWFWSQRIARAIITKVLVVADVVQTPVKRYHSRPVTAFDRPIRSFVLRQGRMTDAQHRALADLMPVYGIRYRAAPLDLRAAFGRDAPKILEIGFGMGETTAHIAAAHPECDYLGIDVHAPGVGSLLRRAGDMGLKNLRIIQHDAVEVVRDMISAGSLAGIHVFFPDPWPKKRHHKRRLLQPDFVHELAVRLTAGGYLHVATDWQDYAMQMLDVLSAEPLLANSADGFAPRPDYRPLTKFEQRGLRLGHDVWDLVFRRTAATPA